MRTLTPITTTGRLRAVAAITLLGLGSATVTGCGGTDAASAEGGGKAATVRYQTYAGQLSIIEVADDLGYLKPLKIRSVGATISGPQDIQSVATDQTDIGSAFNGAVVKLIQAGAPIKAVVGSYGEDEKTFNGFYVLDGSPIRSARDFIGKKVAVNTLGAHSDAVLQIWLRKNGLSEAEIKQVEQVVLPPVNTEQALRQKQVDIGVLGSVLQDKAVARGGLRRVFSDYDLFGSFTAGSYVLRKQYIAEHPEEAKTLVAGVAKAIDWLATHDEAEVVARATAIAKKHGRPEDAAVLKYWKSVGIAGKGGAIAEEDLARWVTWLEDTSQIPKGSVKTADLYTNALNPLAGDGQEGR